mgnify:CR=1 FL=1
MTNRDIDAAVSRNLRKLIARSGLPQHKVAERAGMYQSGLSRSLSGHREWRVPEVVSLAAMFDTTVERVAS